MCNMYLCFLFFLFRLKNQSLLQIIQMAYQGHTLLYQNIKKKLSLGERRKTELLQWQIMK